MKRKLFQTIILLLLIIHGFSQHRNEKAKFSSRDSIPPVGIVKNISDSVLLDIVQRQTFRYFWHFAHPVSGLARERDNTVKAEYYWDFINESDDEPNLSKGSFGPEACAIGGTGMGIMATIVAVNRGWIGRDTALKRLIKIADFLIKADCYHGIYPHFMNGATGKTIPFGRVDDGADIVETSYLVMGMLVAKEYFNGNSLPEKYFQKRVDRFGRPPTGHGRPGVKINYSIGTGVPTMILI